jgi:hypothetical protein
VRRREFITVLGGAAAAWPLVARAQQSTLPVIGFLSNASPDMYARRLYAFGQGLKESGFVEGQNVDVEYRWAEGHNSRLPALAGVQTVWIDGRETVVSSQRCDLHAMGVQEGIRHHD